MLGVKNSYSSTGKFDSLAMITKVEIPIVKECCVHVNYAIIEVNISF